MAATAKPEDWDRVCPKKFGGGARSSPHCLAVFRAWCMVRRRSPAQGLKSAAGIFAFNGWLWYQSSIVAIEIDSQRAGRLAEAPHAAQYHPPRRTRLAWSRS
jgi:hypothetical protein